MISGRFGSINRARPRLALLSLALSALLLAPFPVAAQISFGMTMPGLSIGINVPTYPQMVLVPGYPVYYAPRADTNYFFYDGQYWVYRDDVWYQSGWYNGPWQSISPEYVPVYVLRIPVRYYREPPVYFQGWRRDAAPRWDDHWGRDWQQHRAGWDRWDRRTTPAAAPLPAYQRKFQEDRYPHSADRQETIRSQNYRFQPREVVNQQRVRQDERRDGDSRDNRRQESAAQPQPVPQARGPQYDRPAQPQQQAQRPQQERQVQPAQPEPQEQRRQAEPRANGREGRSEPQERGRDAQGSGHERGRDNRGGERGDNRSGERR